MRQKHTSKIFSSGSAPRLSYKSLEVSLKCREVLFIKSQYVMRSLGHFKN